MSFHLQGTISSEAGWLTVVKQILRLLPKGGTIALYGDLGVGKTSFVRVFVNEVASKQAKTVRVMSPTFPIRIRYESLEPKIDHFDLYRLENASEIELETIGVLAAIETAKDSGTYVFIEWPERLGSLAPPIDLTLELSFAPDPAARSYSLTGIGSF